MLHFVACSGCYRLVELYYNTTLEAHENLTNFHEFFLNVSQLNISQMISHLQTILMIKRNLAVETTKNEKNLTFQLIMVANATMQANELLELLKRNLSSAMNGNHSASVTHSNNEAILKALNTLVNTISDIVSRNVTVLSNGAESVYNQILMKVSKFICMQ